MAHEFIYQAYKLKRIYPPDKTVLENISLSFYPGAKIGVLGSNGAGKSSLLKIMAGLDDGYQGEARLTAGFTVGYLAHPLWWGRFAWFMLIFGVWDIFYYIWLVVFENWPESLFTVDLLFLILGRVINEEFGKEFGRGILGRDHAAVLGIEREGDAQGTDSSLGCCLAFEQPIAESPEAVNHLGTARAGRPVG